MTRFITRSRSRSIRSVSDLVEGDGSRGLLELEAVAQDGDGRVDKVLHVRLVGLLAGAGAVAEADGLVQQLGHGLVVGVELTLRE